MQRQLLARVTNCFLLLSMVGTVNAYQIVIDASGAEPVVAYSDNPFFFDPRRHDMVSLWGPSTITPIGPYAWELKLIFAGSAYASFGSTNRGLELIAPGTGTLLNSISFNYYLQDVSFFLNTDLVMFDAYLYTADPYGNPSGRSARCPQGLCITSVYDGSNQLVMQGMSTAYGTFDILLKGTPPRNPASAPEPETLVLVAAGLAALQIRRRVRRGHPVIQKVST